MTGVQTCALPIYRVGYAFNGQTVNINNTADSFYKMTVTGNEITVKGDVMTYEEQTYNGNVLVGSTATNGTTRTFLSMDPKVIFNGTVNDTIKGKHTLIAKAVEIDIHREVLIIEILYIIKVVLKLKNFLFMKWTKCILLLVTS